MIAFAKKFGAVDLRVREDPVVFGKRGLQAVEFCASEYEAKATFAKGIPDRRYILSRISVFSLLLLFLGFGELEKEILKRDFTTISRVNNF